MGAAWARHAMCESAFTRHVAKDRAGHHNGHFVCQCNVTSLTDQWSITELTARSAVLLEKQILLHLVKKFPAFCGN